MEGHGQGSVYDVMTQCECQRPVFSDPMEWTKKVKVPPNGSVRRELRDFREAAGNGVESGVNC